MSGAADACGMSRPRPLSTNWIASLLGVHAGFPGSPTALPPPSAPSKPGPCRFTRCCEKAKASPPPPPRTFPEAVDKMYRMHWIIDTGFAHASSKFNASL